jgi:hypothetical protein
MPLNNNNKVLNTPTVEVVGDQKSIAKVRSETLLDILSTQLCEIVKTSSNYNVHLLTVSNPINLALYSLVGTLQTSDFPKNLL